VLGIFYGMGAGSIAIRAGISIGEARNLLRLHRVTYRKFWQWAENIIATALFTSEMVTKFGWRRQITGNPNVRSIQNWPVQSHGGELMRAVMIAATETGLTICCPVHDAFLLEAPLKNIEADVRALRAIMRAAGTAVVGVPIETDAKIIVPPNRYMDERGVETWAKVMALLEKIEQKEAA